jgi:hypothetical protein
MTNYAALLPAETPEQRTERGERNERERAYMQGTEPQSVRFTIPPKQLTTEAHWEDLTLEQQERVMAAFAFDHTPCAPEVCTFALWSNGAVMCQSWTR